VLKALAWGRGLRGTPLDLFGRTRIRRLERALAADYTRVVEQLAGALDAGSYESAVAVAESAELGRGYEDVKLRSVEVYRHRRAELGVPLGPEAGRLLSGSPAGD